jgi:16S rRNA C967 or C1407 C5-methylase (RsmB/RsmF family)/NOL1/NOP2/fmu family ribosome biogenesis protein
LYQQLPTSLLASLQTAKGFDEKAFVAVHQSGEQITSVRLNPTKIEKLKIKKLNSSFNIQDKIPWSTCGYYLSERPSFTVDPCFHAGAYYVQEASSMFLEQAIRQTCDVNAALKVLDICAAPGGKSTLIQAVISPQSFLVSNEVIKTRVNILAENITKWGAANVLVTNNDAKDFKRLTNFFDLIVVDAPCSGSGLFRKDAAAIEEWSVNNVDLCSQRQQRILADIMPALKPGGVLIYATCSYSELEDEAIADWLVDNFKLETLKLNVEADWNIIETISPKENAYGYRFYPDKVKGEGFFISTFKKAGDAGISNSEIKNQKAKAKKNAMAITAKDVEVLKPYINNCDDIFFIYQNEEVIAMPKIFETELPIIQSALYIKKAGVKIGTIIRNELIPDHEFAVSTIISEKINTVSVDLPTALQYLRKKDIELNTDIKGWAIITYQSLSLGLVKILPNRINNYYPKDWRILNK